MSEQGFAFTHVSIRRMPGFEEGGPAVGGLSGGVNLFHGPNASGKTSLAKAVRALMWPSTAGAGWDVSGRAVLGAQEWVIDDVTSPCIDAGDPMSPIGHEPFPNGGRINMGAYGGTAEASKSYFGEPLCETIVASDINGDCRVDCRDLAIMAIHWLQDHTSAISNSLVEDGIEHYIQADKAVYGLGEHVQVLYRMTNLREEQLRVIYMPPIMDIRILAQSPQSVHKAISSGLPSDTLFAISGSAINPLQIPIKSALPSSSTLSATSGSSRALTVITGMETTFFIAADSGDKAAFPPRPHSSSGGSGLV